MSSSAHPFNIGPQGTTGNPWVNPDAWGGASGYASTGPAGPIGPTGPIGGTGPTGETGPSLIGITYTSTGANAHRLILQYNNVDGQALTADGGFYRGPTGSAIYYLRGENIGHAVTGGVLFKESINGILYLKSITGGNGLRVEDNGTSVRIRYNTFDAVSAYGPTGSIVFSASDTAGGTGLSGATLTHYYAGPTYALKMTTRTYNEISNRVAPSEYDTTNNIFIYKFNPVDALSVGAARANNWNKPSGSVFVIDPNRDYELWFGYEPLDEQKPFVRILDSSEPSAGIAEYSDKFSMYSSTGFTLMVIDGKTLGGRENSNGDTVTYPYTTVFPINWKFSYSLNPTLTSDIDIIQFITLGAEDAVNNKIEWYGMYVRTEKNINPFGWVK